MVQGESQPSKSQSMCATGSVPAKPHESRSDDASCAPFFRHSSMRVPDADAIASEHRRASKSVISVRCHMSPVTVLGSTYQSVTLRVAGHGVLQSVLLLYSQEP
jgi:hypothetical protein